MSERIFTESEVSEILNHMIVELAELNDNWLSPVSNELTRVIEIMSEVESRLDPPGLPQDEAVAEQILASLEAKKDYEELVKAA